MALAENKFHSKANTMQKKLVVSTTEWLPWLQTSLGDSGYDHERCTLGIVQTIIALGNQKPNCYDTYNQPDPVHLTTAIH